MVLISSSMNFEVRSTTTFLSVCFSVFYLVFLSLRVGINSLKTVSVKLGFKLYTCYMYLTLSKLVGLLRQLRINQYLKILTSFSGTAKLSRASSISLSAASLLSFCFCRNSDLQVSITSDFKVFSCIFLRCSFFSMVWKALQTSSWRSSKALNQWRLRTMCAQVWPTTCSRCSSRATGSLKTPKSSRAQASWLRSRGL